MAMDSFLKLGTLKGESTVKGFEDQIQLQSWGWGMTQTVTLKSKLTQHRSKGQYQLQVRGMAY